MNQLKYIFQKILSFLRVRAMAGGLEVSDEVLRLVYSDGKTWQMAAIRLEPGIMEKGKVKDADALVAALLALRGKIKGLADKKKKANVVMSLSSVSVYSQTFSLPFIQGDELAKAIALNVQMLSPVDISQVYAGSEVLKKDEQNLKIEVLAAFLDKKIADDIIAALFLAGYVVVGVESRPLALMRILREKGTGIDIEKSYLLVNIDNSGLDFLVARNGEMYFEYANQWADLMDDRGQVSMEKFEETLKSSLRQVVNFHDQHWKEPLNAIILSAAAFEEQAEQTIRASSPLPVIRLSLFMGQPVSSEWLVALGCSLRGTEGPKKEKEINLLGEGAEDAFKKDQLIHFLNLWRILVPAAFGLLIVTYALAVGFLDRTKAAIEAQSVFSLASSQTADITNLEASSTAFNHLISLVQNLEAAESPKYRLINKVSGLAATTTVDLSRVVFQGPGSPIYTSGFAKSEDSIIAFKKAVIADPSFMSVDLPITGIQIAPRGFSFNMTFFLSGAGIQ